MTQPAISVVDDVGAYAGQRVAEGLSLAVAQRGRARLAVPGGTGPLGVFRWLAEHLPPEIARATTLTWVDERHLPGHAAPVASDDDWRGWPADSNRKTAWEHWLSLAAVRPSELPLDAEGPLQAARAAVEARFLQELGGLDVVLLGMGPDGHVASLFPGHPALSAEGTVLAVSDSPKPPPERLTLSRGVLQDAERVILVAAGAQKGRTLARARRDASLPISTLRPRSGWEWVLDRVAGEALGAA